MRSNATAPGGDKDAALAHWREQALRLESNVHRAIVGQDRAVRLLVIAVFARGHVLLEGDVGVGKTTLLRAMARGIGGAYERMEGTIDLMPNDLVYHIYIGTDGRPCVDPGPILRHGQRLATFFFNEVNRARPQVHSLLLRVMAERTVTAFNHEYHFPHLMVFADRNRVEKEETFELPAAARDRFLMEVLIEVPQEEGVRRTLMFDPRFHDVDTLIDTVDEAIVPYSSLNDVAALIQTSISAAPALQDYALKLWQALRQPQDFGIALDEVDMAQFIVGGGSPRGMSYLIRAARVHAWLHDRAMVVPEDLQSVFYETVAHRVFFNPVYELRRESLAREYIDRVLESIAAP